MVANKKLNSGIGKWGGGGGGGGEGGNQLKTTKREIRKFIIQELLGIKKLI